jgi:hypothetical protein
MASSTNVTIGGKQFACVPLGQADFSDVAAVYVVLCVAQDGKWTVLDVGQSGKVGSRIESHDRKDCWKQHCPSGNIWVCVYRMLTSQYSEQVRATLESALRIQYSPECGKR